jgi:hypothetical protein
VILVAKKPYSVDSECYDLAVHFLADEPKLDTEDARRELAQEIQDVVESWFIDKRDDTDAKDPT